MCGIFGIIFHGKEHVGRQNELAFLFSALAVEAASRGTDATGLARVENDGYVYTYRNVVSSYEIINFRRWWRPLGQIGPNTLAVLGHTRWGTHGDNTLENAHPFSFAGSVGKIVGTHNGIISNYRELGPTPPFENDSANLFYRLAESEKHEWTEVLEAVRGSFALAWTDGNKMYLARNHGNPCVLAYIEELNATVYASTEAILEDALKQSVFTCGEKRSLPPGAIYEWNPGSAVSVLTRFNAGAAGWSAYGTNYGWDEEYASSEPMHGKFLPKSVREDTVICETCGKESPESLVQYSQDIRGFECRNCRNPRKASDNTCAWCKLTADLLTYNRELNTWLCESCNVYSGGTRKDDVIICGNCQAEFSSSMLNIQVFMHTGLGEYCCEDCYTALESNGATA